ncbi:MAG: hypothetical protein OXN27_18910 [Candidatus Poribacteria bacterium]|nr:hypothetical protein [Candidatus Poribacteria bacterium]
MKARLFTVTLLFVICFCGCSKTQMFRNEFVNVFGYPHIDHGDTIYYLGPWHTEPHAMKVTLKNSIVIKQEVFKINHNDLRYYIPLLIEMLHLGEYNRSVRAYRWLTITMRLEFPNGFGEYYMHPKLDGWTNTPFARDKKLNNTTYSEWKEWWETEGRTWYPKKD